MHSSDRDRLSRTARRDLSEHDVRALHLSHLDSETVQDFYVASTLEAAVTAMGATSGNVRMRHLASPMCAFSVLDQIGNCYRFSTVPDGGGSGIEKALHQFCGINFQSDDSYALYALRNGLMHNSSMTSKLEKRGKPDRHYYFWYADDISRVVQHATVAWDGNVSTLDETRNVTWVNPAKLRELVVSGIGKLRSAFEADPASIATHRSAAEIAVNYLRWLPRVPARSG